MRIKGYDVVALLKKTWREIGDDRVAVYAAQMAYTLFFSIFPLLLFFAALLSLVADPQRVLGMLQGATASLPSGVGDLVLATARNVIFAKGAPGLLSFGLLAAAWSGSAIFGSFRQALNAAFDVTEARPWWKQYLLQLAMLVVAGGVLIAATLVLVDGEGIVAWIGDRVGLGSTVRTVWTVLQIPLVLAAVVAVLGAQYYFLPNVGRRRKAFSLVGAVIATALWIGATLLFRLYVQRFHALNAAYGAIGAIMLLLTWMYYSSFVLLACGELVSELEAGTGRSGSSSGEGHDAARRSAPVPREHALVPAAEGDAAARWAAHARAGERVAPIGGDGRPVVATAEARSSGMLALLAALGEGSVRLVRQELRLARLELGAIARSLGGGTILVAVGGVLALLGVLCVVSGVVLLVGDQWLPADAYWAAALIVVAVSGALVLWLVARGRGLLSPRSLVPKETVQTLEEDAQWLKDPTTSGTTW